MRVLLQEAGQDGSRMPAWKREILERRKAKSVGCGGAGASETTASGASPQRANGDLWGNMNGSSGGTKSDSGASGGGPGRNYTITTANQYFINNKEPRPTITERTVSREDDRQESLVLHESLGPLEENPFIKQEKERRRRQDQENSARPVQHILELYGSVPGIRTIRAENIIIIESDPDYFPEDKSGCNLQQNSVSSYSSLNDLLDRRGSAVTEIRAKEVVIYDTTLSKSEENLSTLGRPDHEASSYETGEGQGRVSRMLQKFDTNYGKLQKKSHSTENLLDLGPSSNRPRLWPKPQPDLVPKPRQSSMVSSLDSSHLSSPVFYSSPSSKSKPRSAASEVSSPKRHFGSPHTVPSSRQWFEEMRGCGASVTSKDEPDRSQVKPTREGEWESAEVPPKPKMPCSPETLRARAESPSSPVSAKVLQSSADFEIRSSPKPDITQIPDADIQARALANLRLQSRYSFTVIPKPRPSASPESGSPAPSSPAKSSPLHRGAEVPPPAVPTSPVHVLTLNHVKRYEETLQDAKEARTPRQSNPEPASSAASSDISPPPSEPLSPPAAPSSPLDSPTPPPSLSSPSPTPQHPPVDHLPVTNIDDIEVEPPQRVPAPSPTGQRRKGNTFTVVPKRRGEPVAQPGSPEPQQEDGSKAPHASASPQAPYAQLGSTLKKRYPAVEEIEVIGGYLSLAKSCLSRTGSMGKKVSLHSKTVFFWL